MEDIKQKLSEMESQVSVIKDPVLKKAAFEKLLDLSFSAPSNKKAQPQPVKVKNRIKGKKSSGNTHYSSSQVRPEIMNMNVTGTLKDFPNFRECGSKMNAYLWVLIYGKTQKIDGMNTHEIAYILSKKLFKPTKYTTVYGIHKKVRDGVVIKEPETDKWRITPDGEDYLKNLNNEKKEK